MIHNFIVNSVLYNYYSAKLYKDIQYNMAQ